MSAELKLNEKFKTYKSFADEVIFFKFIYSEEDLKGAAASSTSDKREEGEKDDTVFKPEFVHQIFGDEETIFGYKGLRISYYLTPGLLDAYIGLSYKERISPQRYDGIEADDVYEAFTKFGCSPGFTRNLDVFCAEKLAADRAFKPYGIKIHEYQRTLKPVDYKLPVTSHSYEIYKIDHSQPEFNDEKFHTYIDRIQTMLVYFIETSQFIDLEDPQWTYFIIYEKRKTGNAEFGYATVGFLSLYNYYAYPSNVRSRISQVLVLPTYQRSGHGAELIESVFRDAILNSVVIDVTAESPSAELIKIRDYVTAKMCAGLESFRDKDELIKGFSDKMAAQALIKLKIPRLQSRRCYEILRLSVTNPNSVDEWRNFRLDIKKRFYMPFIKRSKYARCAGSVSNREYNQEPISSSSAARDSKIKSNLDSRFTDSGVTTIGFGSRSSSSTEPASVTTIGFTRVSSLSNGSGSAAVINGVNGKKTVSFAVANLKSTSLNTSNSTTDNSHEEDDDEETTEYETDNDESEQSMTDDNAAAAAVAAGNSANAPLSEANLFVSEEERKKYLEQQFQETVSDYQKILKRLEQDNVLLCA